MTVKKPKHVRGLLTLYINLSNYSAVIVIAYIHIYGETGYVCWKWSYYEFLNLKSNILSTIMR